jgi:serine protease inhibitor
MRRRFGALVVLLLTLSLVACGDGEPPDEPAAAPTEEDLDVLLANVTERAEPVIADGNDVGAIGAATQSFGLDLYQRVAAGQDGNVIVGPYSAWLALAMTSVGAAGETYDELATALRLPLDDEERLLTAVNGLDLTLAHRAEDSEVSFNVANRLWGQEGTTFLEPFLDAMVEHFGAPLVVADFAADPDAVRQEINGWVGHRTEDRIPELFPAGTIDGTTRLALVNAMHLDAPWEFAFDPEATAEGDFTRADGTTVQVPMMHYDEYLPTAYRDDWSAVELPYEGGGLSMVVIVPEDLAAFEARLDDALLDEVIGGIEDGGIHLSMPRFSFSTHASLVEPLQAMGMSSAFGNADFSRMTEGGGLFISAVEHEAFIEVDEEGTEAAAATGVAMAESHGPTIEVNRPFLFLIRDKATDATLFLGRVLDPTA